MIQLHVRISPPHAFLRREGSTPLHYAADCGALEVARLLVGAGADVNTFRDKNVGTALARAVKNNRTSVAEYLRSVGACE